MLSQTSSYDEPDEITPELIELGDCMQTLIAYRIEIDNYIEKLNTLGPNSTAKAESVKLSIESLYKEAEEHNSKTLFNHLLTTLRSTTHEELSHLSQE